VASDAEVVAGHGAPDFRLWDEASLVRSLAGAPRQCSACLGTTDTMACNRLGSQTFHSAFRRTAARPATIGANAPDAPYAGPVHVHSLPGLREPIGWEPGAERPLDAPKALPTILKMSVRRF
jgi:hypothetical protein